MRNIEFKTERDRMVYEEKLTEIHKGPCSSPRMKTCPCTDVCPIHGRCCDCVRHHLTHRKADMDPNDYSWLPYCLRHADELTEAGVNG